MSAIMGIDIGSHAAKLVVCERSSALGGDDAGDGERLTITHAACVPWPSSNRENVALNMETLGKWLHHWSDAPIHDVVCSLPPAVVDYETVKIPTDCLDAHATASRALQDVLGPAANQVTSDFWRSSLASLGESCDALHLAWAHNDLVAEIPLALAKFGATCRVLDAPAAVLSQCATESAEMASLVVDLGHSGATFVWVDGNVPLYLRPKISILPDAIVEKLAAATKVRPMVAKTLLSQWGICRKTGGDLAERIEFHCGEWLEALRFELQRTLLFIENRTSGQRPFEILLCGGGAEIRGLDGWLERRLSVSTRVASLPANCQWSADLSFSPMYAQAVALVQKRRVPGPIVNLLPAQLARRFEHRRQVRKWASVWTVVGCALLHGQITVERTCKRSAAALAELEALTRPIDLLVNESHQLREETKKVLQTMSRRDALEQGEAPLALLQVVADGFRRSGGELQLDSYRMDESLPIAAASGTASPEPSAPRKKLVLAGSAKSDTAVSELVQCLRSSQAFSQVRLDSSQATSAKDDVRRTFQLQCEL